VQRPWFFSELSASTVSFRCSRRIVNGGCGEGREGKGQTDDESVSKGTGPNFKVLATSQYGTRGAWKNDGARGPMGRYGPQEVFQQCRALGVVTWSGTGPETFNIGSLGYNSDRTEGGWM